MEISLNDLRVLDCEVYPNYVLFAFKDLSCGTVTTVELTGDTDKMAVGRKDKLRECLYGKTTFGFNSLAYDIPILLNAIKGYRVSMLYSLSKRIITKSVPAWITMKEQGLSIPEHMKHFDLIGPAGAPGTSLKMYGARIHTKQVQELPYDPNLPLDPDQIPVLKKYCVNDLDVTIDLFNSIRDRIEIRTAMSKEYGVDVVSDSDAKIAEKLLRKEIGEQCPDTVFIKTHVSSRERIRYLAPSFLNFQTPELQEVLKTIERTSFYVNDKGMIDLPPYIRDMDVRVGDTEYTLGIGGLHSREKSRAIIPEDTELLIDKDVAAYYPSIIMRLKLFPKNIGSVFLSVYSDIVRKRIHAKNSGDVTLDKILKIVINGTYGKLGSPYSFLYSPHLLLQVTITGQLALLLLIERTELAGIPVVSANTDGYVSLVPKDLYDTYTEVGKEWEADTGFSLEETRYKALYSRDVNTYLAFLGYGTKGKGAFAPEAINKNPEASICYDAILEFLTKGTPIKKTIQECTDIRRFICVRRVTHGALWKGNYIGSIARWVYTKSGGVITCSKTGNITPRSEGAFPVPVLGPLPRDLDYEMYIHKTEEAMRDIGALSGNNSEFDFS